jgi:hypothetical protein
MTTASGATRGLRSTDTVPSRFGKSGQRPGELGLLRGLAMAIA